MPILDDVKEEALRIIDEAQQEGFLDRFSLEPSEAERIESRLEAIKRAMDEAPKSMSWRMRDKLGTRVRWYELPEEVQRT